jgi:hypothetical protein
VERRGFNFKDSVEDHMEDPIQLLLSKTKTTSNDNEEASNDPDADDDGRSG